ncbi:MAG: DrmB family protein [Sarcina sp.]
MMNNKEKKRIPLSQHQYTVRFSQAISTYGAGAIVDFKDQTLMAAAPEYWKQYNEIHDERLESLLNVDEFHLPVDVDNVSGLPFVRFPKWHFCPKCMIFKSIDEWEKEFIPAKKAKQKEMTTPKCMECKMELIPAGIVVACENAHIDDFPWVEWVHDKSNTPCNNPLLRRRKGTSALGLEGLIIECVHCKAKATMKGAFNDGVFEKMQEKYERRYKCTGNIPWKGKKEECNIYPKAVQRGALNIYFPKLVSSLIIPPYSQEINELVRESKEYKKLIGLLEDEEYIEIIGKEKIINKKIPEISNEIKQNEEIVKIIVEKFLSNTTTEKKLSKEEYKIQEYNALIGNIPEECMSERDFKIEIQNDIEKYKVDVISRITLVKKLREVRALVGFSRLNPSDQNAISGFDEEVLPKGFVPIKEKETNWYPAYETRGEGIFIELNNEKIEEWLNNCSEIEQRVKLLNERYNSRQKKFKNKEREITPKFVLLHTLSHILIKGFGAQSGYDSVALTERIYCDSEQHDVKMSGILIYTASGDSEGTLGGLVRQGRYDRLPSILKEAIRKSQWCSSDPVCIDSFGQGREGLNLSACHACALISETSCEEFNVLLDRGLIVGTLENKKVGFFSSIVE